MFSMHAHSYEIGYDDGYRGRERRSSEELAKLLTEVGILGASSQADSTDYDEYNRGYGEGMADAAKDWTA